MDAKSKDLRATIIRMLKAGGRGHVGSALSLVEIIRVLYDDVLRHDPKNPRWNNRDRFILSKGHGCMALYAVLQEHGYFPEAELWNFCKPEGLLGGHPEITIPGVEASTGALGHGLPIGIGMALNARYEKDNRRVFVVIGDGESNEGSVWESALSAGKHQLSNLAVLIDYNKNQSYSSTYEVQNLEPLSDKWLAFGFAVIEVNGHDIEQLKSVLTQMPLDSNKPSVVICHTVKGKGFSSVENNLEWHHKNRVTDEEVQLLLTELDTY